MSKPLETQSIQERYEALQTLCKQLMMVNETLKNELARLSSVYKKANNERSLLLDELVEHHSTCSAALKVEHPLETAHQRRHMNATNDAPMIKKARGMQSPVAEAKLPPSPSQLIRRSSELVTPSQGTVECVSTLWSEQEPDDEFSLSSSETPSQGQGSGSQGLVTQTHPSGSVVSSVPKWQPVDNSVSPPTMPLSTKSSPSTSLLTGAAQPQRSAKPPSLVTSSIVSSTTAIMSHVHTMAPRSSLSGFQTVKNFPVVNRNLNIIQTSSASRSVAPVSVVLSSTSPVLLNSQTAVRGAKTVQSPQTSTTLRFTGPQSGQRILIQPTGGNARSLLVQPSENALSGLSGEFH